MGRFKTRNALSSATGLIYNFVQMQEVLEFLHGYIYGYLQSLRSIREIKLIDMEVVAKRHWTNLYHV